MRHREGAEVVRNPAARPEGLVEVSVRQPAVDTEPPVAVPVLELADREDLSVGLDRDVLGSLREEPLRVAEDLVGPDPAVAGEGPIEVSRRRSRRHGEEERGEDEEPCAAHERYVPLPPRPMREARAQPSPLPPPSSSSSSPVVVPSVVVPSVVVPSVGRVLVRGRAGGRGSFGGRGRRRPLVSVVVPATRKAEDEAGEADRSEHQWFPHNSSIPVAISPKRLEDLRTRSGARALVAPAERLPILRAE